MRLNEHFTAFVEEQTTSGRYASVEEVVEAGLALLEQQDMEDDLDKLDFGPTPVWTREALEEAIREGEESGPGGPFDVEAFITEMHRETAARKA